MAGKTDEKKIIIKTPAEESQSEQAVLTDQQKQMLDIYKENEPQKTSKGVIGVNEIHKATETLKKYKTGKENLEKRIIANEQWWKLRHWELFRESTRAVEPASAWLFNSIANKHADAMDSYPEPCILPRARDDEEAAKQLSSIVPVILEQNQYEQVYSDVWWYKLKNGTGVKGIFWNSRKNNGIGDIEVKKCDLLNLFWEPGISDIQDSQNFFHVELIDKKVINATYDIDIEGGSPSIETTKYVYDDTVDTTDKALVIDWYYKKGEVLHYCKYVNESVLYASENDSNYSDRGFYDHGKYPFVFDTLFVSEGSPCGFGYIDIMKDCQMYIDKLGSSILETSMSGSKQRYFMRDDGGINEKEFADYSKNIVHVTGNLGEDSLRKIDAPKLDSIFVNVLTNKIDELKETSGNRDFSQGSTTSGVTAASAIAALQEAGSKLSRDMLKSAYRAFSQECYFVLELMRQFYDEPRTFRISGETPEYNYSTFDNSAIAPVNQGTAFGIDLGSRLPVFDIEVVAAKKSTYSKMAQNELALQFYGLGFFNPQMADQTIACLEMMDFDGKEKILQKISENGTLYQQLMMMQQQLAQMAQIIDMQNGTQISSQVSGPGAMPMPQATEALKQNNKTGTEKAADSANRSATPK